MWLFWPWYGRKANPMNVANDPDCHCVFCKAHERSVSKRWLSVLLANIGVRLERGELDAFVDDHAELIRKTRTLHDANHPGTIAVAKYVWRQHI